MQIDDRAEYPASSRGSPCPSSNPESSSAICSPPMTSLTPNTCAGCGQSIMDKHMLLVEKSYWHTSCLKCVSCARPLEELDKCFVKNGSIYCHNDYHRIFKACGHCRNVIQPHEFKIHVNDQLYHYTSNCFTCCHCLQPLERRARYFNRPRGLVCWRCEQQDETDYYFRHVNMHKPGRPRKKKQVITSPHLDSIGGMTISFTTDRFQGDTERTNFTTQKSKRMRTSFKHYQLRAMKEYFSQNRNPDAKDLQKLTETTSLPKRVLQVWFQNARAKHRRNCALEESSKTSGVKKEEKKSDFQLKAEPSAVESTCSDSLSSNLETSPDSKNFFYETKGYCDDIKNMITSPFSEYSPNYSCKSMSFSPYEPQAFADTTKQNTFSPTSIMTSGMENIHVMTSPCQL
ncbi:LIM/homeobox protein Lhx9-like [Clavelina lepadiformis]|uniref:LIM/homeobox protein Lhx9-like n=1 Tax=Clavelina lepadiformis TaxID=159417 RepID=UPI0040416633